MSWVLGFAIYFPILCILAWVFQKITDKIQKRPPGPYRVPGIGSMIQILLADKTYPFIAFQKLAKYYGGVVFLQIGVLEVVTLNGYETCKELLSKSDDFIGRSDEKWQLDRTFKKPLGLISSHISIWKETRRFSSKTLKEYGFGVKKAMEVLVAEEVEELCGRITEKITTENGVLRVDKLFNHAVLNVVWSMMSGKRFHQNDPKLIKLVDLIEEFFQTGSFGAGLLTAYPNLVDWAPKLVKFDIQQKINIKLQTYFKALIEEIRLSRDPGDPQNFIESFLNKIDEIKKIDPDNPIYSEENLISVLYDMFIASSETTGNLLAFSILYLTLNPKVQEKVADEIIGVLGPSKWPCWEHKEKLSYTDATILELYRISNVVPLGPRKLFHDVTVGPYKIPKGTTALINYYSVSMDETVWPDPHAFRPERFLSPNGEIINADKIMPFSIGKRNCIGEQGARVIVFVGFTGLFQRFKFSLLENEPRPTTEPILSFSLTPKPFSVHAQLRTYSEENF